jgi:hypothetical protein
MNKEIEEKIDQLLDKHIGKVYKDWNEVVKAKEDCRKALANMTKCMTKEEVEKVIFALKKARVFIEYARYELDDGKATIGSQFPHKEDADIETTRLKEAIDLASKLIGRG